MLEFATSPRMLEDTPRERLQRSTGSSLILKLLSISIGRTWHVSCSLASKGAGLRKGLFSAYCRVFDSYSRSCDCHHRAISRKCNSTYVLVARHVTVGGTVNISNKAHVYSHIRLALS